MRIVIETASGKKVHVFNDTAISRTFADKSGEEFAVGKSRGASEGGCESATLAPHAHCRSDAHPLSRQFPLWLNRSGCKTRVAAIGNDCNAKHVRYHPRALRWNPFKDQIGARARETSIGFEDAVVAGPVSMMSPARRVTRLYCRQRRRGVKSIPNAPILPIPNPVKS